MSCPCTSLWLIVPARLPPDSNLRAGSLPIGAYRAEGLGSPALMPWPHGPGVCPWWILMDRHRAQRSG